MNLNSISNYRRKATEMKHKYIITNNAGEQIKGTMEFDNFFEASIYLEGMRFTGCTDCYVHAV